MVELKLNVFKMIKKKKKKEKLKKKTKERTTFKIKNNLMLKKTYEIRPL